MLKITPKKLNNYGDTIVEVMVVLAILGLSIGISYATANSSLKAIRGAQENSQAGEVLQSQVELLRASAGVTDIAQPNYIYQSGTFCLDPANGNVVTVPANCNLGEDNRYAVTINYNPGANDTFTLVAKWDDVQGQGQDTATLVYRVHK